MTDRPMPATGAKRRPPRSVATLAASTAGLLVIWATATPLISWHNMGEERALSLSRARRLGMALLLYVQDWDGRAMAPVRRQAGEWRTWPDLLRAYVAPSSTFVNPANPVDPSSERIVDPQDGSPVNTSYALNRRLWDTFGPGPFPVDDLEIPEATALLVEAGPMWLTPRRESRPKDPQIGRIWYGDTTDRVRGLVPYPSTHDGRMVVVAVDGHGTVLTVEHYGPHDAGHDRLYGRIGSGIYNWNAGHPNGETEGPSRE